MINRNFQILLLIAFMALAVSLKSYAQDLNKIDPQMYTIMNRGMLWETIFNSGMIGESYNTKLQKTSLPIMEWPPRSEIIYNKIDYSGQENSFGGGIYIGGNQVGQYGVDEGSARMGSFAGTVGKGKEIDEPWAVYSYPVKNQSLQIIKNYPLNDDGTLNSDYNPDEAELKVITKWVASDPDTKHGLGITVTRISRQWSFPDDNDFIIHEYTLENTGDLDGDGIPDTSRTLMDVTVSFNYSLDPSMYGLQRYYDYSWNSKQDQTNYWDPFYWLQYNQVIQYQGDTLLAGLPETDPDNFSLDSKTGANGGGLMSPQAAGFMVLHYDTTHLSVINFNDSTKNQSWQALYYKLISQDSTGGSIELTPSGHVKQPWADYNGNVNLQLSKVWSTEVFNFSNRQGKGIYPVSGDNPKDIWVPDPMWIGREAPQIEGGGTKAGDKVFRTMCFGPYYLKPGDKIHFAIAELCGYGAQQGRNVIGGITPGPQLQPVKAVSWHHAISVANGGKTEGTKDYLKDYGYPDYVDSHVRTIQDVALQAIEAYMGKTIQPSEDWTSGSPEFWPGYTPQEGVYKMPLPIPAPKLTIEGTTQGTEKITWGRAVEQFQNKYPGQVMGKLVKFNVYRSDYAMGPWQLLGSIKAGDVNNNGEYEFIDDDRAYKIGETKYYAVTSVDDKGDESGKTNFSEVTKTIGPVDKLGKVYVVPNPFILNSGFAGTGADQMIGFYGLPKQCTIYVFSFAGQLVKKIEHNALAYSNSWDQVTLNSQQLASGMYYFVVTTPQGDRSTGKFVIIK